MKNGKCTPQRMPALEDQSVALVLRTLEADSSECLPAHHCLFIYFFPVGDVSEKILAVRCPPHGMC